MTNKIKITAIAIAVSITVAIHYGFVLEPIFGESHWIHAIHGRFCYIPIVMGASLFGIRGGLITAFIISSAVLPYVFIYDLSAHNFSGELVEIIFYFALALLTGYITEQILKQQREKESAQLQLERAHRLTLLGQMAATMAHEIKNPLASIKGSVEILSDENTNSEDKKEFEKIVFSEIKRVDTTIKDFLNFAKPKEIQIETLNLSDSCTNAVKQITNQADKHQIKIISHIQPDIIINGDSEKIHQLLLNLLINAIDASEKQTEISIELKDSGESEVEIVISDNGSGIKTRDLEHIFEPFYTTKSSGTGLGLAVVKSIVDAHQGSIAVHSETQSGTKFSIKLPKELQ